jgi:hypothetical protein
MGQMLKLEQAMSYDKFPDRLSRPMSCGQAATLRRLSLEAYQRKLFEENLTRRKLIDALRRYLRKLRWQTPFKSGGDPRNRQFYEATRCSRRTNGEHKFRS